MEAITNIHDSTSSNSTQSPSHITQSSSEMTRNIEIQLVVLLHIPLPPLVDEISFKICVSIHILNFMVNLNKVSDAVFPSKWTHRLSHEFVGVIQILAMLIINDHVVQDHDGNHDVKKIS